MPTKETLTPAQRRTLPAREAFARKFVSPEQKSAHYRELAKRAHAGRIVLSGEEAQAFLAACDALAGVAERARRAEAAGVAS